MKNTFFVEASVSLHLWLILWKILTDIFYYT